MIQAENGNLTIGVVAICKNEELNLPHFLAHLLIWVDEIIIVDDASSDLSREIIANAGAKVRLVQTSFDETTGFAGLRNQGIELAKSDWLLHMDIDERVSPELAAEILTSIKDADKNAFRYYRLNYFLNRPMQGSGWQYWNHPQLARRGFHKFRNKIHEQCDVEGGDEAIGQLNSKMLHLNDHNYLERLEKSFKYCQLDAEKIIQKGYTVRWFDLILRPLRLILAKYLIHKAHRDGIRGLILTLHSADAVFRAYALAWDYQNQLDRDLVEQNLTQSWEQSELYQHKQNDD